jgi:biopolymer transport protein TolR
MAARPLDPFDSGGDGGYRPLAEINVTPFVDVMLVLLIIFMVTAPLMTVGIKLTLPRTAAAPTLLPQEPVVVSIDARGHVFLKTEELGDDAILSRLRALNAVVPDRVVLVRGDRTLGYGRLVEVIGLISRAGFSRVSLVAESRPPDRAK